VDPDLLQCQCCSSSAKKSEPLNHLDPEELIRCLVEAVYKLRQLNSVLIPQDQDDLGVRSSLLKNYNIDIGAGLGPLEGKIWRIGLMGHTSRKENIELLLSALKETL
jgi:alanine-glyoxylate transaminase/serine-glyoxylate transaminase/serine-pyruvate transaminase